MSDTNVLQTVKDRDGRVITFKGLSVFEQTKILRVMQPEHARNMSYVAMVMTFMTARSIDGVPLPWPKSEALLDAHMEKVGDSGWLAIKPVDEANESETDSASTDNENYLKNS